MQVDVERLKVHGPLWDGLLATANAYLSGRDAKNDPFDPDDDPVHLLLHAIWAEIPVLSTMANTRLDHLIERDEAEGRYREPLAVTLETLKSTGRAMGALAMAIETAVGDAKANSVMIVWTFFDQDNPEKSTATMLQLDLTALAVR